MGFDCGAFLSYALPILELQPRYICYNPRNQSSYACNSLESFCIDPMITHTINWDDSTSLHNWVETLDMACKYSCVCLMIALGTEPAVIGLLGSMFFVGWASAAPFVMRLVDIFGRKKVYIIDMTFHAVFYLGVLLSKNLTLTIAFQFCLGIFAVGRAAISFLYLQELLMT